MFGDQFSECFADLRILHGFLKAGTGNANAACGDIDPAKLQPSKGLLHTATFDISDQICIWHEIVVEGETSGIDTLVAQLFQLFGDGEPVALFNKEQTHTLVSRSCFRICLGQHGDDVAVIGIAYPHLGAVQPITALRLVGAQADGL